MVNTRLAFNRTIAIVSISTFFSLPYSAQGSDDALSELKQMSLESLLEVDVTSVSKQSEKLWKSAAAVHVIDQEAIRRSGVTTIPELLRQVPGINVAKINSNSWAITARGFNGRFSNKLLVLMDGRSVYTPLYSGVYWDVQDTILEDIERIEVIRGPGATVWGANAVNGVINIITKSSKDTQGGYLAVRSGDEEQAGVDFRYGGEINPQTTYRVYGKGFERDGGEDASGVGTNDSWDGRQAGFRIDSEFTPVDIVRIQGDIYTGDSGQAITLRTGDVEDVADRSGGNLLFSWNHIIDDKSGFQLNSYYDRTERHDAVTSEERDTLDIDFNHFFPLNARNRLNWGVGYRYSRDNIKDVPGSSLTIDPLKKTSETWSGFIQDEIALVPDIWTATLGTKVEHNSYTGWELQPSARLAWTPDYETTIWGSISKAIRSPSRIESDYRVLIPGTPGLAIVGNTALQSEEMYALEVGLRKQLSKTFTLDAAAYYNRYDDLRSLEFVSTSPALTPPFFLPATSFVWVANQFSNKMRGTSYGLELSGDWRVQHNFHLKLGYSWHQLDLELEDSSSDTRSLATEDYSPSHQLTLQALWNISKNLELDTSIYYVDRLKNQDVPAYTRMDIRLGWQPSEDIETSLVVQNLLDERHPEFTFEEGIRPTEVERSIYGQVTWRY